MDANDALAGGVEQYLELLSATLNRWRQWLESTQRAIVAGDIARLERIRELFPELAGDVETMLQRRQELLQQAAPAGIAAPNIRTLARHLGSRFPNEARRQLMQAEVELNELRRMHASLWVLANQLLHYASGTLRLVTSGSVEKPVYNEPDDCEVAGNVLDEDA